MNNSERHSLFKPVFQSESNYAFNFNKVQLLFL